MLKKHRSAGWCCFRVKPYHKVLTPLFVQKPPAKHMTAISSSGMKAELLRFASWLLFLENSLLQALTPLRAEVFPFSRKTSTEQKLLFSCNSSVSAGLKKNRGDIVQVLRLSQHLAALLINPGSGKCAGVCIASSNVRLHRLPTHHGEPGAAASWAVPLNMLASGLSFILSPSFDGIKLLYFLSFFFFFPFHFTHASVPPS